MSPMRLVIASIEARTVRSTPDHSRATSAGVVQLAVPLGRLFSS
jgi:hypothetical protein